MKVMYALAVSLLLAGTAAAVAPVAGFDRYQIILERKPFGAPGATNATPAAAVVPPASQLFAKGLRLTFLGDMPSGLRAGLINTVQTNQSYFLGVGEQSEDGIELLAVDYAAEEATLRKGTELAVLKLNPAATNATAVTRTAAPAPASGRPSFGDRHRHGSTTASGSRHSHAPSDQRGTGRSGNATATRSTNAGE